MALIEGYFLNVSGLVEGNASGNLSGITHGALNPIFAQTRLDLG